MKDRYYVEKYYFPLFVQVHEREERLPIFDVNKQFHGQIDSLFSYLLFYSSINLHVSITEDSVLNFGIISHVSRINLHIKNL